ncbi:flagellar protein FlbD [Marinilactibacillus piezotolerans]|uniref:Flagellar protein FlbD n=1 Tax=Marinilactibacillus piezotolerans TaxID=258723 RepID=A0A1I3V644_9LACT|nr:flagellar FlbD family protein [Marinilactibacillus piezotolerans]SFJ90908.1 flagellar protein FlbD [Marinilactibacillus piezotolerans]
MILLKSLAGKEFYLNCDLIYKVEKEYDTLITLVDQKTIWVQETPEEIRDKVIQFKNQVYRNPWEVKE